MLLEGAQHCTECVWSKDGALAAAGNVKQRAVDVGRRVGEQPDDRFADLVGACRTAHRHRLDQAFEAAGYRDAFQVRLLPEDADPMDVRYNVIQWVHRSTRGWSYGSSVVDPRTGEILKGHVTLGSLRVRQDYLIAEGLLAPYADATVPDTMLEMSLARIRQLSAHEVGHTLGFEHNFAASTQDRASVMDYPAPLARFTDDGSLDLSDAYASGIGRWDTRTVMYAYDDAPDGEDADAARARILAETIDAGYRYVADADARRVGTAHPDGNLWDNGADAIEEEDFGDFFETLPADTRPSRSKSTRGGERKRAPKEDDTRAASSSGGKAKSEKSDKSGDKAGTAKGEPKPRARGRRRDEDAADTEVGMGEHTPAFMLRPAL